MFDKCILYKLVKAILMHGKSYFPAKKIFQWIRLTSMYADWLQWIGRFPRANHQHVDFWLPLSEQDDQLCFETVEWKKNIIYTIVFPAVNWLVPIYVQCTWVERGFKMSCPRTQRSAPARARTNIIGFGAQRTKNNEVHD